MRWDEVEEEVESRNRRRAEEAEGRHGDDPKKNPDNSPTREETLPPAWPQALEEGARVFISGTSEIGVLVVSVLRWPSQTDPYLIVLEP